MIFFSSNLRYLRMQKGWKQDELAVKLGLKGNSVSNYEKDKSSPDFTILEKIVTIFGVNIDHLLFKNLQEPAVKLTLQEEEAAVINKQNAMEMVKVLQERIVELKAQVSAERELKELYKQQLEEKQKTPSKRVSVVK